MDTINAIAQLVANLGVPVSCLIGAFWLLNQERKDHKEEVDALRAAYDTERKQLTESITNNTLALTRLCEKLDSLK